MQHKTILSTLLLSALTTLSASALAETQKDLDTWHNMGSFSLPAMKSTDLGAVGAEFFATSDVKGSGSSLEQVAEAGVNGWIFSDSKATLLSFYFKGTSSSTASGLSLGVKLFGASVATPTINGLTLGYKKCGITMAPSSQLWVGPVPVVVKLQGGLCGGISVGGSASADSSGKRFQLTVAEKDELSGSLSVGVGVKFASAGIKGSLKIVEAELPIATTLKMSPSSDFSVSSTGTLDVNYLRGTVALYAKAGWGILTAEYEKELFDWTGISSSYLIFSDEDPTATDLGVLLVNVGFFSYDIELSGRYSFGGPTNEHPDGSSYEYWRADGPNGENQIKIASGRVTDSGSARIRLDSSMSNKYVKYCVTPRSVSKIGVQACSSWLDIGPVLSLYQDINFGGGSVHMPYHHTFQGMLGSATQVSGVCYGSNPLGGNPPLMFGRTQWLSSFRFGYGSDIENVSIEFFKSMGCTGESKTEARDDISSAGTISRSSLVSSYGSDWNDSIASIRIKWNEYVSAANVAPVWLGDLIGPSYDYISGVGRAESGTTYAFQRADNAQGANLATAKPYSFDGQYQVGPQDEDRFLRVCVKPSDGVSVGKEVCSPWSSVGKLLTTYDDANFSGPSKSFPYERVPSGTCVEMGTQNNKLSSYTAGVRGFTIPSGDTRNYRLAFYTGSGCTGSERNDPLSTAGGVISTASVGSSWNDQISSFKVVYRHVRASETMAVISGASIAPAYNYFSSVGRAESGTTFRWQRADSAGGTNTVTVQDFSAAPSYNLAPEDDGKFMRVCVRPSDGEVTGQTSCSTWGPIGKLITLYDSNTPSGGAFSYTTRRSFPLAQSSGQCIKLSDHGMDNNVWGAVWADPLPTSAGEEFGAFLFDSDDCSDPDEADFVRLPFGDGATQPTRTRALTSSFGGRASSMRVLLPKSYSASLFQ